MSSILTNTGAMVALQTLKGINTKLGMAQGEIATGKTVSTAKDNAAVWAISKVMESDVKGFKGIQDSLNLGESTVAVARQAAETVTDLLVLMKAKIVAAQEDNVDRAKLQTDIQALQGQVNSVVGAAQFNGLNLVNGTAGASIDILASLDRDTNGNVTASSITVNTQDLSTGAYTAIAAFTGSTGASANADTAGFTLDNAAGTGNLVIAGGVAFAAGDKVSVNIGGKSASYTVTAEDVAATTPDDMVAVGMKNAIDSLGIAGLTVDYDSGTAGTLAFTNAGTVDLTVSAQYKNAGSGGLATMSTIDVSTSGGATTALGNIETLITLAIDASAELGSSQTRLSIQSDFVSKLSDALTTGIGIMVDADMEEVSARLQSLQVQQQLGIQALSIANGNSQSILSLFR